MMSVIYGISYSHGRWTSSFASSPERAASLSDGWSPSMHHVAMSVAHRDFVMGIAYCDFAMGKTHHDKEGRWTTSFASSPERAASLSDGCSPSMHHVAMSVAHRDFVMGEAHRNLTQRYDEISF